MNENEIRNVVEKAVRSALHKEDDITLFAAQRLSSKIRAKASEIGVKAVVAITNKGANPVLVECSDDSLIASYDIALNKAWTVVSLKMSTKKLSELAKPDGSLYGIQFTNNNKVVIFGGGEPLINENGVLVGGLGVSGGTEEQDTLLATFGKELFEKGNY